MREDFHFTGTFAEICEFVRTMGELYYPYEGHPYNMYVYFEVGEVDGTSSKVSIGQNFKLNSNGAKFVSVLESKVEEYGFDVSLPLYITLWPNPTYDPEGCYKYPLQHLQATFRVKEEGSPSVRGEGKGISVAFDDLKRSLKLGLTGLTRFFKVLKGEVLQRFRLSLNMHNTTIWIFLLLKVRLGKFMVLSCLWVKGP